MKKLEQNFGSILVSALLLSSVFALSALPGKAKDGAEKAEKSSLSQFWQEDGTHYNLATSLDATFKKVSEKELELAIGTYLIESENGISVKLPMSRLEMPPKSMALIRIGAGVERVFCLLETMSISCENRSAGLRCGEEALLTDHLPDAGDLNGEFEVGVRQLRAVEINETRKITTMEFSLIQTMEREPLLSQITHSRHKHDRFLRDKLIKAAAVLNYVTNRHGPYSGY